ncbi:antigen-presenting glycoprotein CD1d-like [Hyperolius riggenbachi]|uniref:antigen-presenting glycoprotein CD1d-like n=1 Tax=Hyperolius riggenbachi TaxID=752182 RepID=UPI0035A34282
MKQLIPFMTLYLSSSVTVADSLRMRWLQTYQFSSDRDLTFSCSVMVEDIEVLAAYNDTWLIVFKQSWSKGNFSETEWMFYNMFLSSYLYYLDIHVDEIGKEVGLKGAFTLQCWTECPSSADDIDGYSYRVAVDGVDLVYLNITERAWVAGNSPYSQAIREIMQKDPITLRSLENGLNKHCQSLAAAYATTGREAFSRKVQPQVYLVRKPLLSKTEILCMVTGFYPKPINVSLWRENKMEDGMSTETLPNGDSTYQITVMTTANLFEEEHFSCHVEHISLQEPLIVRLNSKHHTAGILDACIAVVAALACMVGLVYFVELCNRRRYTSISGTSMEESDNQMVEL